MRMRSLRIGLSALSMRRMKKQSCEDLGTPIPNGIISQARRDVKHKQTHAYLRVLLLRLSILRHG